MQSAAVSPSDGIADTLAAPHIVATNNFLASPQSTGTAVVSSHSFTTSIVPSAASSASTAPSAAAAVPATSTSAQPDQWSLAVFLSFAGVILTLFVLAVVFSYQQAVAASSAAVPYDDASEPGDMATWNTMAVRFSRLASVNASVYRSSDNALPMFCNATACDYTSWAGDTSMTDFEAGIVPLAAGPINANYVRVELTWGNLVPATTGATATLSYRLLPPAILLDSTQVPPALLFDLQLSLTTAKVVRLPAGSSAFAGSIVLPLTSGSLNLFPADVYSRTIDVALMISDAGAVFGQTVMAKRKLPLDFLLKVDRSDTGLFSHTDALAPAASGDLPVWSVSFSRPAISRAFPIFIICSFWVILGCELMLYFPWIVYPKKADNPAMITISTALLFALPGIRNILPGSPPYGAVLDLGSFFFAMLTAIFCFAFIAIKYLMDNIPAAPAAAK